MATTPDEPTASAGESSAEETIEHRLSALTLEEKCMMVHGADAWTVPGCARLGIPDWCLSDGPVGVRGRTVGPGLVVPGPTALAATWNPALVEQVGQALGVEANDRKVDVVLGPTVNLHRSPRGGRHFESYSEDPELSSRIAVAYIIGVQSQGVGACVKHFVANDQEHERFTIDVQVDERTLREIYLPPFEAAVIEAEVRSVMGAYNFVNGHHACAHPELLVDLLKREWGFAGFVVSDWGSLKETVAPARWGLDLEMPGPGRYWGRDQLLRAVRAGEVDDADVDDKVRRILRFLEWAGRLDTPTSHDEATVERPEHRALARRAATESMVLVANADGVLPLDGEGTVALIGAGVAETAVLGGGSASLSPHRTTTVLEEMGQRLGDRLVGVAPGIDMARSAASVPADWIGSERVRIELHDGFEVSGEPFAVEERDGVFNVWFGESWPEGHDAMSVRMSFSLTPPTGGRHRLCAIGFAHAQLFVDDTLVADNQESPFSAGLGLKGGEGYVDLEAGVTYRVRLDHFPREGGQWVCLVDVGAELAGDNRDARLVEAEHLAGRADTAVVVVGSTAEWESEGADRDAISLPNGQDELVQRVMAANPQTVVVLNCGAPMTLPWLDDAAATLIAWYPGQEAGPAIADVLLGAAEPGGRMPTSWAADERHTPAYLNYPGEAGVVRYGEGVFVGYRSYDARGVEPMIPFGHGGSYTTFYWGAPNITGEWTDLTVEVPVTNTGGRAGSDVVQVYVGAIDPVVSRPPKELAGFAKVHVEPGATVTAVIRLRRRAFARWDPEHHGWVVDPGEYRVVVAASAVDVRSSERVTIP
ncbi:glycoside hydrolase family 3 C-terminal domain-containing protein [Candidatus Poriferisocius sp.]|uniref:glycoside hydrolase family 3 C-terminal domain-containing protein n=1 Tax=Candidatus Poriferisocius sp. TaxID=3101276 RepID=UPI003B5AB598